MKKAALYLASFTLLAFSLSLRADSVLTTINIGSSEGTGIAANPATNKIYAAIDNPGQLVVIDGKTQQVIKTIPTAPFAIAVAVNPLTNRIYASGCQSGACTIFVVDGKTDTVLTTIPIASGSFLGIQGLAVNPVTNLIYASDADNGQYIVIDGKTNTVTNQVSIFIQPAGIAVNPKTNRIYIGNGGFPGEMLVYDGATNAQVAIIPISSGSSVQGVVTNFRLNTAYGALDGTNALAVVNGATNQEVTEVPTGAFPRNVDVNLVNNKIYVPNGNDPSVTIIDGNTNQVLQTLPIPTVSANGVAVNPATGLTYITDFSSNKVVVLQPK
jgi:YVTN family beta-propeller protein